MNLEDIRYNLEERMAIISQENPNLMPFQKERIWHLDGKIKAGIITTEEADKQIKGMTK